MLDHGQEPCEQVKHARSRSVAVKLALAGQPEEHAHDHAIGHVPRYGENRACKGNFQAAVENVEDVLERREAEGGCNRIHDRIEHVIELGIVPDGVEGEVLAPLLDSCYTHEVLDDDQQDSRRDGSFENAEQDSLDRACNESRKSADYEDAQHEARWLPLDPVLSVHVYHERNRRQQSGSKQQLDRHLPTANRFPAL